MFPLLSNDLSVYIVEDLQKDIKELISDFPKEKIFLLCDTGSFKNCYPLVNSVLDLPEEQIVVIPSGDDNKNLETTQLVWQMLSTQGADRKSLLINLGGGMPTDLGGFAASTFKRGIKFINIPTTLLAQVDASIGGKTGINFEGYKNEIGVFQQASTVLVGKDFFKTLDQPNMISGYAEMIKHAFIYSEEVWNKLKSFNISNPNLSELEELVAESIRIKNHFVENDPTEKNIRKALNFGHTFGHAFESLAMYQKRAVLHGHAVAFGMICELYLSHQLLNFPFEEVKSITDTINSIFGTFDFTQADYDELYRLMTHDKKNEGDQINFTLIEKIGKIKINCTATKEQIFDALDFYQSAI